MRRICFLLCLLSFVITTQAQRNGQVKGVAYDTLSKQAVANATITLLQKKDSSLISFTMTDNNGRFQINGIANGEYRLLITHVNYHNNNKQFKIEDNSKDADLGQIVMHDSKKVLEEVVVTGEAPPVTLINDTIQYNAGSFKVQPNSNVEDLLKRLPGVKVERDGTVKAQGETVKRVLVDGKEFFGNDPKIATKNLPADAIDKVQVYDRMSDQAQLTGFDDGNSEKTINLKLKKDKKKGLFGKATIGGGTNDRFEGRANINSFKGARQMSVIGMGNNTNSPGFSFMDMLNFSGELSKLKQGGGSITITKNADPNEAMLGGNNNGINTIFGGGVNYNNIIGKKTDFQSNYFYNRFNPYTETQTQRSLPDSSYLYNEIRNTDNLNNSHRLNMTADIIIDTFHSFKIMPGFSYQDTRNSSFSEYTSATTGNRKTNEGVSNNQTENSGFNFRNDLLFRKKFRRKGRTFSISLGTSINNSDGAGRLESINRFFDSGTGSLFKTDSINQKSTNESELFGYNARIVYTEPIFKRSLLEFSANKSNTRSTSEKITYDYNKQNGKFDQLNPLLTNDYENEYGYTQGGIKLRTQLKKFNYAIGLTWQQADLIGKTIQNNKDTVISKSFNNFLPNARFQYNFTKYKNLVMNYMTMTNQPSVSQLQPVPDISNPLNIRNGNPNLQQEFTQMMRLQFTSINPFKNRNLFVFLNATATNNKIVNFDLINQYGVKVSTPVNVDGIYNVNGDVSVGVPIRFLKGTINISTNTGYSRNKNFFNGTENTINTITVGPDVRLDMNLSEKAMLSLNAGYNFYSTNYSIQKELNTNYITQNYGLDLNWELPKGFYFATDFTYTLNSKRAPGFNTKVPFWNASLSKQFLNFNRGEIKFRVFDILNQNVGVTRNTNNNYIEDIRQMTLRRFFMLSFTYSLSKAGLGPSGGAGMKMIMR